MFAALETKLETIWNDVTGEARAEAEKALADLKDGVAKVEPVARAAEADLLQIVASAEPELKAAVESRAGQFVADILALLNAPTAM